MRRGPPGRGSPRRGPPSRRRPPGRSPLRRNLRPLTVVVYAAFIGLLLASYLAPLQQIVDGRDRVSSLENDIDRTRVENEARSRQADELQDDAGIERAARDRYGMVGEDEEVYVVPEHMKRGGGGD